MVEEIFLARSPSIARIPMNVLSIPVQLARSTLIPEKVHSSRLVSLILVWLAFFMGMVLTNDVTLVTLVPFAIALMKSFDDRKTLTVTLILMTVATNLGSMQTPIGNPQNIYLYTHYDMSMGHFLLLVLPYSLCALVLVTIAVFVLCKDMKIQREKETEEKKISGIKLAICAVLFVLSLLVVLRVIHFLIAFAVLAVVMLIMDRKAFMGVDYTLLITFVFFFVFDQFRIKEIVVFKYSIEFFRNTRPFLDIISVRYDVQLIHYISSSIVFPTPLFIRFSNPHYVVDHDTL